VRRALAALASAAVFVPVAAQAQVPAASFSYSPASPLSGQVVTFTSTTTGTITGLAWDLDGNGACDDALGASAARSFATSGLYGVTLCVNGDASLQKQTIVVRNRPPVASFSFAPVSPLVRDTVMLTSTSADPDGPIAGQAWDIDGDGQYDDGGAVVASIAFGRPGAHTVGVRVVDRDGATSVARRVITVATPPIELLSPFPVVRLSGVFGRSAMRVDRLAVRAPSDAKVRLSCAGRDCPYRVKTVEPEKRVLRFRRLERRLRSGTVLKLFVTKPGTIGKYTRFRVRRGRAPTRKDACLLPGSSKPEPCPSA
jgi:hypothetical protein